MNDDPNPDVAAECLSFPVESPLTASYDTGTGILTVESTLYGNFGGRGIQPLRLDFSPDAVHGLVRLLSLLEEELAAAIADCPAPTLQH